MSILAGDIGGTHARLATFEAGEERPRKVREETWPSPEYDALLPILEAYLEEEDERPGCACLALAGPVEDGVCRLPNLGWEVDEAELSRETGIGSLRLINDFDAIGHGILVLEDDSLAVLQEGEALEGAPIAVVGAGTGLGVGYIDPAARPPRVYSSEGGHADFAPRDERECELARFLAGRHGRASWERVLSGEGLADIYRWLRGRDPSAEREAVREEMEEDDPAAVVSRHGLAGDDPLSARALRAFVSAYGAQAGNLALTFGARGGVFVAGGIAPKILEALRGGPFLEAFLAKGRMREYVADIPVRVVLDEDVGLLGSAAAAASAGSAGGGADGGPDAGGGDPATAGGPSASRGSASS
ncbi:MAG TPA: glucokinase [Gemmatimonadota bacterium]|nr:glucokinase [Gemmatimonadota bacterium]